MRSTINSAIGRLGIATVAVAALSLTGATAASAGTASITNGGSVVSEPANVRLWTTTANTRECGAYWEGGLRTIR